jgi:hypothetical protein
MNSRFRKFVTGSTRRPSSDKSVPQSGKNSSTTTLTPAQPAAAAASSNGTSSASTSLTSNSSHQPPASSSTPAAASASTTSLAMNPQQPLGRPPSYQYANQGNNLGAPHPNQGRPTSPMPPPPINTGGGHAYAPQHQQHMYGQHQQQQQQQAPAPPGYPMQQQQQAYGYGAPQANPLYGRSLAEVEGNNRSKAQLIVGIDFVGRDRTAAGWRTLLSPSPPTRRPKRISSSNGLAQAHRRSRR